jgi:hypothetical protein
LYRAECGTISPGGLYTPPASVPSPATVRVTVTSVADPTKLRSKSKALKTRILSTIRDIEDILVALEPLTVRVVVYVHLLQSLYR